MARLVNRLRTKHGICPEGFSLLEMMLVVTLILIVVSIATPSYKTCPSVDGRVREAVLRDHLYTLRFLIDRFTLDNGRAPLRLKELVQKGYLGRLSRG
jgi:general secretion pathway protein G